MRCAALAHMTQAAARYSFLPIQIGNQELVCKGHESRTVVRNSALQVKENTLFLHLIRLMELAAPGRKRPIGVVVNVVPENWLLLPLYCKIKFIFILLHEFTTGPGSGRELAQDELSTQQKFPLVNAFPLIPFCFGKLRKQKENRARQLLTYQNIVTSARKSWVQIVRWPLACIFSSSQIASYRWE